MKDNAVETIRRFWEMQNNGDYVALVELFTEDAVLEDPVWGRYEGKEAILGFMKKMVEEMGDREIRFEVLEICGGSESAWAQWRLISPQGTGRGVGIYKVRDGKLSYYRDYYDSANQPLEKND